MTGGNPSVPGHTEYVRADLLEAAEAETEAYRIREELHVAELEQTDKLASAERRIAELVHSIAFIKAEGERRGREAGIREAAEVCMRYAEHVSREAWLEMTPAAKRGLEYVATRILALLAKKPEVVDP